MAEEDIIPGENTQIPQPEISEEDEREIEGLEVSGGGGGTLDDAEAGTDHKTDMQYAMGILHPKYSDKRHNELMQSAMVARIFPDNYLEKMNLIVLSLVEEHEGDADIDVLGFISKTQDALSIGYEGRDRAEMLELAGVAHEAEMEKLSKELGLGG